MKEKTISSEWAVERGRWDGEAYVGRTHDLFTRKLTMVKEKNSGGKEILRFIGGPTGYESYYIEDLLRYQRLDDAADTFCICGGTINRWPRCTVSWAEVRDFIEGAYNGKEPTAGQTEEGYDACMGHVQGKSSVCCGHGVTNKILK